LYSFFFFFFLMSVIVFLCLKAKLTSHELQLISINTFLISSLLFDTMGIKGTCGP
jgi:hypothetical protein